MDRRSFLKKFGVAASSLAFSGCLPQQQNSHNRNSTQKPNIVIIIIDDLGYNDIGCYDNKNVKTPNIDALAKGGMRFTDFHTNAPSCSPTRASLLTGLYPQRSGIEWPLGWDHEYGLDPAKVTFAEVLKKAGYKTALFGKWHLGCDVRFNPIHQGFDEFRGYLSGDGDYQSHIDRLGQEDWWDGVKLRPDKGYSTNLIADYSIDFIKRNKNNPFCLYVANQAVHFPFQGPKDKADRFTGKTWHDLKYGSRQDRKEAYKEMIESMDANLGRIVKAIKEAGLEENTLIFFTSDNGGFDMVASNAPLRGFKFDLWEGGHRVPGIAYWPGKIKPDQVTNELALTFDLLPTMAELAGVKSADMPKVDGVSMAPLLLEGKKMPQRTIYWNTVNQRAVREGLWKLVGIKEQKSPKIVYQLFRLDEDLGETNDLADKYPQKLEELKTKYDAWFAEVSKGVKWQRKWGTS